MSKPIRLGLNVDHVATLRQARGESYPSPLQAALIGEKAGCHNITCHLREDRRHIQDEDIFDIKRKITIPFNLEMAATDEMLAIAKRLKPEIVTLVPERREELTTEGGLDLEKHHARIRDCIDALKKAEIEVVLFVEPDLETVHTAYDLGADGVELHTGRYALARKANEIQKELARISTLGNKIPHGLRVHLGHGINLSNLSPLTKFDFIHSMQIGHAIISDAIFVGLKGSVQNYLQAMTPNAFENK